MAGTSDTKILDLLTIERVADTFFRLTREMVQEKGEAATWYDFPKDDFTKLIMDKIGDAKGFV